MPAIQISTVSKRYGSLQALGGVSLAIDEGEFFGLLGPNGAGKTTLISIIAGLSRADSGTVACWAWCRKNWSSTRFLRCAKPCACSPVILG
jgi:ABC-type multidrug transport system ATPase subunit